MPTFRIVAWMLSGTIALSSFLAVAIAQFPGPKPPNPVESPKPRDGLPPGLKELDVDGDGQVGLHEWRDAGRSPDEFRKWDRNDDGFITAEEVLPRKPKDTGELTLEKGRGTYTSTIELSADEKYKGKSSFKIFDVHLVEGKTYQFDHFSSAFQAFLYLEDPDGAVAAESGARNIGENTRLVFKATQSGTYRIIATSVGGYKIGPFTLSISVENAKGALPLWFKELDSDGDGQVGLFEWRAAGRDVAEFQKLDRNDDGFITADEALAGKPAATPELKFEKGAASYAGALVETTAEKYRGKLSFQIFDIYLVEGQTYQIDLISKFFQAFIFLEDPDGAVAAEKSASTIGENSRLIHKTTQTGTYRIVATSLSGYRTGAFTMTVVTEGRSAVPMWFKELDTDEDGQIGLYEWRAAGRDIAEFRMWDRNDDGYITADEVSQTKPVDNAPPSGLKFEKGEANYAGSLVENKEEKYRGKISYQIFEIRLLEGKTYQFDQLGKSFQSFLFLEDPDGAIAAEKSANTIGENSRLVYRATQTGTYRIIATTLGGYRTGAYTLSIRVGSLPSWFKELDVDGDSQVGLAEWRKSGRTVDEFFEWDRNDDGFITAEEAFRELPAEPKNVVRK